MTPAREPNQIFFCIFAMWSLQLLPCNRCNAHRWPTFSPPRVPEQLLLYVLALFASFVSKVHWSAAKRSTLFSKIHPWMKSIIFCSTSSISSLMTLKVLIRRAKIVHLQGYLNFGTVISSTWACPAPKVLRPRAKVEHLETGSRFELMFSMLLSNVTLFQS